MPFQTAAAAAAAAVLPRSLQCYCDCDIVLGTRSVLALATDARERLRSRTC